MAHVLSKAYVGFGAAPPPIAGATWCRTHHDDNRGKFHD